MTGPVSIEGLCTIFRAALMLAAMTGLSLLASPSIALSQDRVHGGPIIAVNLFETDDQERHIRLPQTASGSIVLIIDPTTDKAGTGFLIAPCYAMSALHVVLSDFDVSVRRYPSVRYEYTLYYGSGTRFDAFDDLTIARPVAWGGFFDSLTVDIDASEDWIILQLDECVGRRYGHFQVRPRSFSDLGAFVSFALAGYPRTDDYSTVQVDPACRIHAEHGWPLGRGAVWYHDCATREGASGSPIYTTLDDGLEAVAIAVGELQRTEEVLPAYSEAFANIAVPMRNAEWALTALESESPERVAEAQELLQALGRGVGRVDGVPDANTRSAIESYRSLRRMPLTGLITDELIARLQDDLAARATLD